MKLFVIQPNFSAKSEVWLYRMNQMLESYICGMAAFLHNENVNEKYPVFNLNGRRNTFIERQLIRFKLLKLDSGKRISNELLQNILKSGAEKLIVHYATTAHYLWNVLDELTIPIFIYAHGFDVIWNHKSDEGVKFHSDSYVQDILNMVKKPNVQFIANSMNTVESLVSIGVPISKISKKVFGVEIPVIDRDYSKNELKVLYLGRFVDFKGPDIVLESFIKACDMGFEGSLVMAGDGPLKLMCEIIARRSLYAKRITFTGAVTKEHAENLFRSADIYTMHNSIGIISNGYDTFGVTFIEAMSYGLPIITAPVGGPAEIIEDGVDGLFVKPNDIDNHAKAFMQLFYDKELRKKIGVNGISKIRMKYSSAIEKQELFDILGIPVLKKP